MAILLTAIDRKRTRVEVFCWDEDRPSGALRAEAIDYLDRHRIEPEDISDMEELPDTPNGVGRVPGRTLAFTIDYTRIEGAG